MLIYFLIDTSGSMIGAKIGALNDAMTNIIAELQSEDTPIEISVWLYSNHVRRMYSNPIPVSDFEWENVDAGGMTAMGTACLELAKAFEESNSQNAIVIIISDGYPTDDFEEGIAALNASHSFTAAKRYAIAVEGADVEALKRITGNPDMVFQIQNLNNLTSLLSSVINESIEEHSTSFRKNSTDTDDEWD